jgi:hypothetical protein
MAEKTFLQQAVERFDDAVFLKSMGIVPLDAKDIHEGMTI